MAAFDKAVPPGGKGNITLKVKTRGYRGPIAKTARVFTNDPRKQKALLTVQAYVKVPIYLTSPYVFFYARENQKVTRVVEIRAELDRPLTLAEEAFDLKDRVTYQLEEVEKGRKYLLRLTMLPGSAEVFQGYLKLKTNYPEKPELTIRIRGKIIKKKG